MSGDRILGDDERFNNVPNFTGTQPVTGAHPGDIPAIDMTMRDVTALAAMQGRISTFAGSEADPDPERTARFSYAMADAMLKARSA